jgi:hypothetical protein
MTEQHGAGATGVVLALMVAAAAIFFLVQPLGVRLKSPGAADDPGRIVAGEDGAERHGDVATTIAPSGASRAPVVPVNPFFHLPRTRAGLALESDPFLAESAEEQRWLDRHGYPNSVQYQAYSVATDGLLQQAADSGDRIAGVFLDSRKLLGGDPDAAGRLLFAGSKGSSFALANLQAYMAGTSDGDRVLAYALARVMEMKGDSRSALVREGNFASPLTMDDRHRGELMALQILEQFQEDAGSANLNDPRPIRWRQD